MLSRSRKASEKFLSGEEFKAWRTNRGLTQKEVGEWLGLSKGAVLKYEIRGVTRAIALALSALERGLQPWTPTEEDHVDETQQEATDAVEGDHEDDGDEE